jgi:hypothetical protein
MRFRIALLSLLVGFAAAGPAWGAPVDYDLTLDGQDSGWTVTLADNVHSGVVVDSITSSYVIIEVIKTFWTGPESGQFNPNLIQFTQRLDSAHTVPSIWITSEAITNLTGADWTGYHWEVDGAAAAFNKDQTDASVLSIGPFVNQTWGPSPVGQPSHAMTLDVDGGTIADGDTYFPGSAHGRLYVDVDLGTSPVSFTLKQYPTPEPCSMGLLLLGAVGMLAGRRKGRGSTQGGRSPQPR